MNRKEAPHQSFAPYGVHDRKVKLRDPRPVYLQPLPRDASCVNKTNLFGSHRGCRRAGRPLHRRLRLLSAGCRPPSWFSYGKSTAQPALRLKTAIVVTRWAMSVTAWDKISGTLCAHTHSTRFIRKEGRLSLTRPRELPRDFRLIVSTSPPPLLRRTLPDSTCRQTSPFSRVKRM